MNGAFEGPEAAPVSERVVDPDGRRDDEAIDRNYAAHFAFLDYIFGTAVKSDQLWPEKYGVLGDYVPNGFVKQFKFPFTWKG